MDILHFLVDNLNITVISGNINNSLMTLKACLETLNENRMLGTKKLIPYRDSKLTYLFKNFFERESCIHAIICVNPRAANFDDTVVSRNNSRHPDIYVFIHILLLKVPH
jgi:hypothetical protein